MTTRGRRLIAAALVVLATALPPLARAEEDRDHDLARDLYRRGEIMALADVLAAVKAATPGDVLTVGLVHLGDRWVYRFQIVAPDGRRTTVDADARTATIVPGGSGSRGGGGGG
jgi:uncharacterized membrane protein YkoI